MSETSNRPTEPDECKTCGGDGRVMNLQSGTEPCGDCKRSGGPSEPEVLDACCGGRMWWWDKDHPLAVYMDNRIAPRGSRRDRPNWEIRPDVLGDFRSIPFKDESFQLVLFDPPHIVRERPSGNVATQYGALQSATEQDDLRAGFGECWRVLAPGGTLVFKWAGDPGRVERHFPAPPIVGTRPGSRSVGALGTRWFIFYKPVAALAVVEPYQEALAV